MSTLRLGKFGEQLAKNFLIEHGYEVIDAHWQKKIGEIDVIARDLYSKELIFVEVKTRTGTSYGYPEETVNKKKIKKINKTAQWFLLKNKYPANQSWRIDVISIIVNKQTDKAEITHFKSVCIE